MTEMVLGLVSALIGAVLFAGGGLIGWIVRDKQAEKPDLTDGKTPEEIQKERSRLIAEQEAFQTQMNYNADMAYGLDGSLDASAFGGDVRL